MEAEHLFSRQANPENGRARANTQASSASPVGRSACRAGSAAGVGRQQADDHFDERAFAGPVRTEQAEDLAAFISKEISMQPMPDA